jgi:molybdopterin synthase catalytic subunit
MAQRLLAELCAQAIQRFGVLSIRLIHSKAFVPAGEVSLFISIRSERRSAALEAMTWLIEALKRDVPIWKRAVAERCEENLPELRSASGGSGVEECEL